MWKFKKWAYAVMLPRGAAYPHHDEIPDQWEKVFIQGKQDVICTEIRRPSQPAKGVMILAHPYRAEAKRYFTSHGLTAWYLSEGWTVATFDFNGFGESPFTGFRYDNDILAVAHYIQTNMPGLPVALHGISFGAAQSIVACGHTNHGISHLIVENCLDNYLSYFQKRNISLYRLLRVIQMAGGGKQESHNYILAAGHVASPMQILFVYCVDDKLTTYAMGRQLMEAMPLPSKMLLCKGKHLEAFDKDKTYYTRQIARFLSFSIKNGSTATTPG